MCPSGVNKCIVKPNRTFSDRTSKLAANWMISAAGSLAISPASRDRTILLGTSQRRRIVDISSQGEVHAEGKGGGIPKSASGPTDIKKLTPA